MFAIPMTDEHILVRRHRAEHAELYDGFGEELDQIEKPTGVGTDLQFATFWFSTAITSTAALPGIPETSTRYWTVFLLLMIVGYTFGVYFLIRWRIQNKGLTELFLRIRTRPVGPVGEEGKEIRPEILTELPSEEPPGISRLGPDAP